MGVYTFAPMGSGSRDNIAEIHRRLREAILRGEIAAGAELSQVRLADDFGVSRGPVREALRLLQREGLVEAELNRRVRVARFSVEDLEQLYAMRIVTEALGIRATVPFLTDEDLAEIQGCIEEMEACAVTKAYVPWEHAHRRFHHALIAYAGERVVRHLEQLSDHSERYRRAYVAQDPRAWSHGAAEHREIAAACVERDPVAAADALARHLARTALTVLTYAAPDHEPTLVRTAVRAATGAERTTARPTRVAAAKR
jgi:DNA-binding GntR family transcriptional regulator